MDDTRRPDEMATTDLRGAARFYGVSLKTFRDRFMPHVRSLEVSAPSAQRKRRRFSIESLREAMRRLEREPAA